jgi:hypothetical protein
MANLTIAAASVLAGANAAIDRRHVFGGASVNAGQIVYLKTTEPNPNKWFLADNNATAAEARVAIGVALNTAAQDQPLAVLTHGDVTLGAVLTAGVDYYLSDTPGAICPQADIATAGETFCFLGLARSTSVLAFSIQIPGVTV